MASDALVFPVDAQAVIFAPTILAWVEAAVMPLSLKLPDGLNPSYCKNKLPVSMPITFAN